jgi:hypothetical protein
MGEEAFIEEDNGENLQSDEDSSSSSMFQDEANPSMDGTEEDEGGKQDEADSTSNSSRGLSMTTRNEGRRTSKACK